MWTCEKCHGENPDSTNVCQGCGERSNAVSTAQFTRPVSGGTPSSSKRRVSSQNYDGKPTLSTWLDVFGWVLLVGGIIAAVICFSTMAYAENEIVGRIYSKTQRVFSWTGFILSVGVLFSSVLGFLGARGLAQLIWDSSTSKSLTMQMYDKAMNDD